MSPNEPIPRQAPGYFSYMKEAALVAYIEYQQIEENNYANEEQ